MCKCSFALALLSVCAWTQSLPVDDPKEAVVAVVNGRKITLSEYKRILEAQDPSMRAVATQQPKAFLEQYALFENVLTAAEKAGFDQQSPFKERIAASRKQILITGFIDEKHKNFVLPPEEAKKFYDANPDMYQQAMVRVVFISRMTETRNVSDKSVISASTPEVIKERIEKAAKLAREGVDFGKVALEFSDDKASAQKGGAFPHPIRPTSANVPENIRVPILAAKAGDIVGPIEHDAGFYIFKIESNGIASFDQVKEDIVKQMKDARLKHWLDEFKKSSSVTVSNESLLTEAAKSK